MLPLLAEFRIDPRSIDERGAVRRTLRLEVRASSSQDATKALIRNLSERGLLIETAADLAIGDTIEVELPEAGSSAARIIWTDGSFFGCEFVFPVSRAAVSAALLLAPIEPYPITAIPDVPPHVRFGEEDVRSEFIRDARSPGSNLVLMTSLTVALVMVAIFIYALLAFPFSS